MQKNGNLIEHNIDSSFLNESIPLLIYLPERYSHLKKYPVLFVQDGWDYIRLGRLTTQVEQLINMNLIEEIIIVALPVQSIQERNDKYTPTGKKNKAYIRFLGEELVPYIDREFSTLYLGGSRVLMGDSLGGVVSLHTALQYPHTFSKLICQSSLLLNETKKVLKEYKEKILLEVYLSVGNQEDQVTTNRGIVNIVQMNKDLAETLKKIAKVTLNIREGDHTWKTWQADIMDALKYFWSLK